MHPPEFRAAVQHRQHLAGIQEAIVVERAFEPLLLRKVDISENIASIRSRLSTPRPFQRPQLVEVRRETIDISHRSYENNEFDLLRGKCQLPLSSDVGRTRAVKAPILRLPICKSVNATRCKCRERAPAGTRMEPDMLIDTLSSRGAMIRPPAGSFALALCAVTIATLAAVGAAPAQHRLQPETGDRSSALIEPAADEMSRTPYQAYLAADCLTGSNFCKFASEVVRRHRRLKIHRASCQGWHASATPPNFVVIAELQTEAGVFVSRIDFLETSYKRIDTNTVWAISERVRMFIPAGHRLLIRLNSASTGVGSYGCTISGYLVTLGPSS